MTVGLGSPLPAGVVLGVSNSIAVTIPRNDFDATVSVTTTAQEVAEGESLTLEFTRTAGDQTKALTIPLTVSGGAQASDYTLSSENVVFAPDASTASVTLDITDDPGFEALETVTIALGVLPSETSLGTPKSVTITIPENDADTTVSVVTSNQEVAEGDSLTLEFSRAGGDQTDALTIPLLVSGGAQAKDYTLSSENVVFAPGVSTASVTLDIVDDQILNLQRQ